MHPPNCYCITCLWDKWWNSKNATRVVGFLGFCYISYMYLSPYVMPASLTGFWEKNSAILQTSDKYKRLVQSFPTPLFVGATDQHRIGMGVQADRGQITFAKPGVYQIEYITNVYLSNQRGEINKYPVDILLARIDLLLMKNDKEVIHRMGVDVTNKATPLSTKITGNFQAGDRVGLYAIAGHINGIIDENLNAEIIVDTYSFIVKETEFTA